MLSYEELKKHIRVIIDKKKQIIHVYSDLKYSPFIEFKGGKK